MAVEVKFWGVRGSIPCSSPDHIQVGGHTSCVSLYDGSSLLIFDAGTGLYDLGEWCVQNKIQEASLFLSHAHFDHVVGLPFFKPIWNPNFKLNLYSSHFKDKGGLRNFLSSHLFKEPFFPNLYDKCAAVFKIIDIDFETPLSIQGYKTSTLELNHPGGSCGYRVSKENFIFSYVTDHEDETPVASQKLRDFVKFSDLLVYDATFTKEEYEKKEGWGHSSWEQAVTLGQAACVKRLALFHHDPSHTDEIVSEVEVLAKRIFPKAFAARQGMIVQL